ncbi:MAG: energy-coupling factor transporter ATPase, partial [Clostridia bacterium]|nr:energy-coupling factor transporter ATPase [Clostridia bacterium]
IAGVIAMQPKVLVLDEPVAGLDPVGRAEILALIKQLQKDVSPTIIMVSHNMDDIAVLADRIVAMHDGRIELDGTPEEVFCNREKIKEIGLDLPMATRLRDKMVANGINLPDGIVTPKQLENALLALRDKGDKGDEQDV